MVDAGLINSDELYLVEGEEGITYTFANGTAGNFTVTPSNGETQTVSVGLSNVTNHQQVHEVAWDKTNKKITRSKNGAAGDVVQFVQGDNITLTAADGKLTIASSFTNSRDPGYGKIKPGAASTAVTGITTNTTSAEASTYNETLTINPGNKWIQLAGSNSSTAGSDTFTIGHALSGVTAGTTSPNTAQTPGFNSTFNIPTVTFDAAGHITSTGTTTVKIPAETTLSGGSAAANDATVAGGVTVSGHAVTVAKKTLTAGGGIKITGATDKVTIAHSNASITAKTAAAQSAKTLTWGGTFTLYEEKYDAYGHITGVASYNMTMPANPNTDEKVKQNLTSGNASYKLLTTTTASPTSGTAYEANYSANLAYNPSENKLSTGNLDLTGELDVVGNANLHNATSIDSLTAGSLIVNGNSSFANDVSFTKIPTAPTAAAGTSNTQLATTAFVSSAVQDLAGPMRFIGTLGSGGTITTLPAASDNNKGHTYKVIAKGTYQGIYGEVGDLMISNGTAWVNVPSGDVPNGTITNIATGSGLTGGPITTTGTISHADTSNQASIEAEANKYISAVNLDGFGHVTGLSTATIDPYAPAINGVYYGVCDTDQATKTKTVTLTNGTNFTLATGCMVAIKFTNASAAATMTLNVNNTGEKNLVLYGTSAMSSGTITNGWRAGAVVLFVYDGTSWVRTFWENSTYWIESIYISTSASTAAKVGSSSNYTLEAGKYFQVLNTYSNTAASALTLNINSKGAKPIYINGAASSASNYTLPSGYYLVYYDGTNYYFRTDGKMTGDITGNAATADVANSVAWGNITGKPSSFTPSSHTHYELATQGDNRGVATTPNDYANRLVFRGLKTNSSFGSPSTDTYSYVVGLRGWSDSSGGNSHELAFNNTGIYWRSGATTSWGSWYRIYTTGNKPTKSDVGLGNVTNDAQIPKSIGTTKGDIIYWSAASTPARLGIGSAGQVLKVSSDGIPTWSSDNNSDTKNTAGSTDTSSKIFLIGATEQSANPQTYSDNEVYTTSGVLTAKEIVLSQTGARAITFSRTDGYNYIQTPASGGVAICASNSSINLATSTLLVSATDAKPGRTDTYNLGTSSNKWKTVYATTINSNDIIINSLTDSTHSTDTAAAVSISGGLSVAKKVSAKEVRIDNNQTSKGASLQYDESLEVLNFVFS